VSISVSGEMIRHCKDVTVYLHHTLTAHMSTHFLLHYTAAGFILYNSINSTESPASVSGNVTEPRLTSQVGRVCEVVCA